MVENPSMPTLPSHKSLFMDFAHGPCQLFWKRLSLQPGGRRLGKCFMVGKNNAATRSDPTFLQLSTKTHQIIRSSDEFQYMFKAKHWTFGPSVDVPFEANHWCFPLDVFGHLWTTPDEDDEPLQRPAPLGEQFSPRALNRLRQECGMTCEPEVWP